MDDWLLDMRIVGKNKKPPDFIQEAFLMVELESDTLFANSTTV